MKKKSEEKKKTGDYLLVGGAIVALLIVGVLFAQQQQQRLATVGIDTTLAQITPLYPVHADTPQTGLIVGGDFNPINNVSCRVTSISGIKTWDPASMPCFVDFNTSMWYFLKLVSGTIYDGVWAYDGNVSISYTPPGVIPPEFTPIPWTANSVGYHQITIGMPNQANNTAWLSIGFYVTTQLVGEWSINGQPISHATQTIWFGVNVLTFKFTQASGITATSVTVTATKTGSNPVSITMTRVGGVWTGIGTFADGVWQMTLTATDGTYTNTLSIVGQVSSGAAPPSTTLLIIIICIVVAVAAVYYVAKKREKPK